MIKITNFKLPLCQPSDKLTVFLTTKTYSVDDNPRKTRHPVQDVIGHKKPAQKPVDMLKIN